jgi:small-conductance mechanosensitive channel
MIQPLLPPASLRALIERLASLLDQDFTGWRLTIKHLLVIWVFTWLAWRAALWAAARIVATADQHHDGSHSLRDNRARTIAQLIRSTAWGVLLLLALFMTVQEFVNITPLLGGAAVIGLAVSFGAQSLVKDYFAGFFILLEGQFVVGDSIEAAGKAGTVERLTLRAVRLRDVEGTLHIIPNGQITTLSNKTRGWSRAVVDVGVSYESDVDQVLKILEDTADAFYRDPQWQEQFDAPPEVLGVDSFGDLGINIRTWLRTHPGSQAMVGREFRRRVLVRLEQEGIKGARAQQTISIQSSATSADPPPTSAAPVPPPSPIPGSE